MDNTNPIQNNVVIYGKIKQITTEMDVSLIINKRKQREKQHEQNQDIFEKLLSSFQITVNKMTNRQSYWYDGSCKRKQMLYDC